VRVAAVEIAINDLLEIGTEALRREAKTSGVRVLDVSKRLLDYGHHAPTTYFPLLISECLLIEPTENESREVLDAFVAAMIKIHEEAE
jgi:glycine dehydrogenase subunit 2